MRFYQALVIVMTFSVVLAPAARATAVTQTDVALMRFMVISDQYREAEIEFDDDIVARLPVNTLSGYIPVGPYGHMVLYGISEGGSRNLINGYTASGRLVQPRPRSILVFQERGEPILIHDSDSRVPAGKSMLRLIVGREQQSRYQLSFGDRRLSLDAPEFRGATHVVEPQTAPLELREADSGRLLQSQYLRVQPGYRYEVIVGRAHADAPAIMLVVPTSPQLVAHATETRLFTETGHYLEGRLREYWESTGGLPVFGFPLNDDHLERTPEGTFVTQIFERNRLEYHAEQQPPYDVLLGRLGDERLRQLRRDWRAEWTARPIGPGCEAMQTGDRQFVVCEPFRSYYHTHGLELDGHPGFSTAESLALLGLPLTQAQVEINSSGDRVLTQWFERARLEHHPGNPAAFQVLLGRLGAEVYDLQPLTFDDEDRGFQRMSAPGGQDWREARGGFGDHYWWTCTSAGNEAELMARWDGPPLRGTYEIQVFVPAVHSNSRNLQYSVRQGDHDRIIIPFQQQPYGNQWVTLGTTAPSGGISVVVSNQTGERSGCETQLAADAIRLVPAAATSGGIAR